MILGFIAKDRGDLSLLLVLPPVAALVNVLWSIESRRIVLSGAYIRETLWPYLRWWAAGDLPCWEDSVNERRSGVSVIASLATDGLMIAMFAGSGAVAWWWRITTCGSMAPCFWRSGRSSRSHSSFRWPSPSRTATCPVQSRPQPNLRHINLHQAGKAALVRESVAGMGNPGRRRQARRHFATEKQQPVTGLGSAVVARWRRSSSRPERAS